jgi:hypothetical protein
MRTIVIEEFSDFCERMGCDHVSYYATNDTPVYLFANGGMSDGLRKHQAPPDELEKVLHLKNKYYEVKVRKLRQQRETLSNDINQALEWRMNGCHNTVSPPEPQDFEMLRRMSTDLRQLQAEWDQLKKQLPEYQDAIARSEYAEQFRQEHSQHQRQLLAAWRGE